jgi:hypothetical protein
MNTSHKIKADDTSAVDRAFAFRLPLALVERVDLYGLRIDPQLTRSDVIRRLLRIALEAEAGR